MYGTNKKGVRKMKTFVITEYPKLIRKWKVIGKSKKEAYENWLHDKIELIEEDYDQDEWNNLTMEKIK
jgi:hypothetical protein